MGALQQAPKHSTSTSVNLLSFEVSPILHPVISLAIFSNLLLPRNQHGVVLQI